MKQEERYARRLGQALNQSLDGISPATARRLEAARHIALSRQKQAEMQAATVDGHGMSFIHGIPYLKQGLAILALLIGMYISFYWQSQQYINELEEVDSALLSDDLPPEAFIDKGFSAWLQHDSDNK